MHINSKLAAINELTVKTETLLFKFCQSEQSPSHTYLQEIFTLIDDISQYKEAQELGLNEILPRLKVLFTHPVKENTFHSAKQFVENLYEYVKQWSFMAIHSEDTYNDVLLSNYYQTQYAKNALMIYILHPFIFSDASPQHTNQVEAHIMAETLSQKGYNIDIINTQYTGSLNYDPYDLIIGFGPKFDDACFKRPHGTLAICYLTECSPYFSNLAELQRLREFEKRNHYLPNPERQSTRLLNIAAMLKADAAICLGNEHTISTYKNMFHKIYPLNVSGFPDCSLPTLHKSYQENRKNFLWYGGAGPVHKGLDLCIEAFRSLPAQHLSIAGEVTNEFYQFYKDDLEKAENISYYGFLSKDSLDFRHICEKCGFCLAPSCSESQSTAVITTMFSGILPVCTKETGINVQEFGGVLIHDISIPHLTSLIQKLSTMEEEEFLLRQRQVYDYVSTHHSAEAYGQSLNIIFEKIITEAHSRST